MRENPVYNKKIGRDVGEILVKTGSYNIDLDLKPEEFYTWSSGIRAPLYCNVRDVTSFGEESKRIGNHLTEIVRNEFSEADTIIGLATAGIGWAGRVSDNLEKGFGYIRSKAKSHGQIRYVEGVSDEFNRAVIIDDLVASGSSINDGIEKLLNEKDAEVLGVVSVVNWNFDAMKENLKDLPDVYSLTSYPFILESLVDLDMISLDESEKLAEFYQNPSDFDFEDVIRGQKENERLRTLDI